MPSVSHAILPQKRPFADDTPESPEHPRKKTRVMDLQDQTKGDDQSVSTLVDDGESKDATAVDATAALPMKGRPSKTQKVPHIDLVRMRRLRCGSSTPFEIQIVKKAKSAPSLRQLQSVAMIVLSLSSRLTVLQRV